MEHIFESNILWDGPITLLLTLQWSTNGCLQMCTCYLHFLLTYLDLLSFLLIRLYFRFLLSTSGKTALGFLTKL